MRSWASCNRSRITSTGSARSGSAVSPASGTTMLGATASSARRGSSSPPSHGNAARHGRPSGFHGLWSRTASSVRSCTPSRRTSAGRTKRIPRTLDHSPSTSSRPSSPASKRSSAKPTRASSSVMPRSLPNPGCGYPPATVPQGAPRCAPAHRAPEWRAMPRPRSPHVLLAAVAGLAVVPGAAHAATVAKVGDVLTYTAAPGERNSLTVDKVAAGLRVTDDRNALIAGAGCSAGATAKQLICATTGVARLAFYLGDDNDFVGTFNTGLPIHAEGGPGNDELHGEGLADELLGGDGNDTLRGGGGNDTLDGGTGDDRLLGDGSFTGAPGDDTLIGGAGRDVADYAGHTTGVTVDLADPGTDGAPGEHDALSGIEDLSAPSWGSTLMGDDGPNRLYGSSAADVLKGAGGADTIAAGDGDDTVDGGDGDDALDAGGGKDTMSGAGGDDTLDSGFGLEPDVLDGGPGADELTGSGATETLIGGPGADTLDGGDGDDTLDGGADADTFVTRDG